jgi:hypothetical protein
VREGVRDGVYDGMRDGVRGPEIVGIWSMWMNLLTSTEYRGPFADVEAVHGQKNRRGWVPRGQSTPWTGPRELGTTWTTPTWMECVVP